MADCTVRTGSMEDAASIALLNRTGLKYIFSLEETKGQLEKILSDSKQQLCVAEVNDRFAGYLHACIMDSTFAARQVYVIIVAVHSEMRTAGVEKNLLAAAEDWGREMGAQKIFLAADLEGSAHHALYEGCGYENQKKQLGFEKELAGVT